MVTKDENEPIDRTAILSGPEDGPAFSTITITPESVAVVSLVDCSDQLAAMDAEPRRLALAAKSAHLALQAALIAALAGTANIGAHDDRLFVRHLAYLHDRGAGEAERPVSDRVMSFADLLAKAAAEVLPWGDVFDVSQAERLLLDRLTKIRHDIEHPKQQSHVFERAYIFESLLVAARLVVVLMRTVFHHLDDADRSAIESACISIEHYCEANPANLPGTGADLAI